MTADALPPHILVAEDQADIRDLLVMNLRGAGYEVAAVADGRAALASQTEQRQRPADPRPDDAGAGRAGGLQGAARARPAARRS